MEIFGITPNREISLIHLNQLTTQIFQVLNEIKKREPQVQGEAVIAIQSTF